MFYRPENGHGLPHNPFNAIVTPRPIGWISTRGKDGHNNLAPYSFFNAVAYTPPQVMFASTSRKQDRHFGKDSVANIDETGVFCVNVVSFELRDAMNKTSGTYGAEVDEFDLAGLERAECETIACSRVAAAPAALECKVTQIVKLEGEANVAVFGEVTGVYMNDACMTDGRFDVTTFRPLARLGYRDYSVVDNLFALARPDD
ncbi:MAG: flavin reductase family protein [Paracoccaceae bacterium]|nr:flavin reductase family protein [Paracoccaceae bacterium]